MLALRGSNGVLIVSFKGVGTFSITYWESHSENYVRTYVRLYVNEKAFKILAGPRPSIILKMALLDLVAAAVDGAQIADWAGARTSQPGGTGFETGPPPKLGSA